MTCMPMTPSSDSTEQTNYGEWRCMQGKDRRRAIERRSIAGIRANGGYWMIVMQNSRQEKSKAVLGSIMGQRVLYILYIIYYIFYILYYILYIWLYYVYVEMEKVRMDQKKQKKAYATRGYVKLPLTTNYQD